MLTDDEEKVLNYINEKELVDLAVEMGNIYSPAGNEVEIGNFIYDWLLKNNFNPKKYFINKDRFDVVTTEKGEGGGKDLIFNAHMETELSPEENKWAMVNPQEESYPKAWVEGNKIFGRSVLNDRGSMAAYMIACKAIKNSGIKLKGNLIQTMVIGEIGMAPVDEFEGLGYEGKGLGTEYLVHHGITGDYAIVAETTNFGIVPVEAGACYYKITVEGNAIYTPRFQRPEKITQHPNAIVKMAKIIEKIEEWAIKYEKKFAKEYSSGMLYPKANIGAIRGGVPYRPARTSGLCCLYGDIRIPPDIKLQIVTEDLQKALNETGIDTQLDIFFYKEGFEAKNIEELVEVIEKANKNVRNKELAKVLTEEMSMWRDINIFNKYRIPALVFGPTRQILEKEYEVKDRLAAKDPGGKLKYFEKKDLLNAAKIYGLTAINICNKG